MKVKECCFHVWTFCLLNFCFQIFKIAEIIYSAIVFVVFDCDARKIGRNIFLWIQFYWAKFLKTLLWSQQVLKFVIIGNYEWTINWHWSKNDPQDPLLICIPLNYFFKSSFNAAEFIKILNLQDWKLILILFNIKDFRLIF